MSTQGSESRRPSSRRAAVRRRRTLAALAVLVVVAIAVTLLVWRPWQDAAPQAPAPTPVSTDTPGAGSGDASSVDPSAAPSAAATAPSDAAPSAPASEPFTPIGGERPAETAEPCSQEQLRLVPQTDHQGYAPGEAVRLSFTIENTGESACTLNAGTAVQEYEVRTGDDLVYRWSDCAVDVQDDIATLEPGAPRSTVPVEWDRTSSSVDTCTAEREQVSAGGTAYRLTVTVGERTSDEAAQFVLE